MSDIVASQYRYQSAVVVNETTGLRVDVSAAIAELQLYENITSIGISGKILIVDNLNLFDRINFSGTETLDIEVLSDATGTTIKKSFVMVNVDNKKVVNDETISYVFSLMSKPVFRSNLQVLSKAYEGTPLQIIGKILTGNLGVSLDKTLLEGTDPVQENMSVISPYLTPIETIQWIRNMCTTEGSGFPFFLFGTIHSDDIKVTSLENIMNKQPEFNRPFVYSGAIANTQDTIKKLFTIEQIEYNDNSSTLTSVISGAVGAKYEVLDTVYGTSNDNKQFKIEDALPDTKLYDTRFKIDDKKISEFESNYIFSVVAPTMADANGYGYNKDTNKLKSKVLRNGVLQALNMNGSVIKVNGLPFMASKSVGPGSVISIEVVQFFNNRYVVDDKKSGRFIISSLDHQFFDEKHTVTLGVSKL